MMSQYISDLRADKPSCLVFRYVAKTMNAPKLIAAMITLLAYVCWWQWISQFPLQLTSDDALNFARGVQRFSVLEFRPHFPGYPAFIGVAHIAARWCDPQVAVIWVSLISAMLIPLAVARLIFLCVSSLVAAVVGCLLVLSQPLLASIALSGLSDATAILFTLLSLMAASQKQYRWVGVWLGLMLATRPSYFVLALGVGMFPWWHGLHRQLGVKAVVKAYFQASWIIAVIGALSLGFIWAHDGKAYIDEGIRFTQGHFAIWGNTVEGNDATLWQWVIAISNGMGWPVLVAAFLSLLSSVFLVFFQSAKHGASSVHRVNSVSQLAACASVAVAYWTWISLGQNPDNLRHWAPVLFLFLVVIVGQLSWLAKSNELWLVAIMVLAGYDVGRNVAALAQSRLQPQAPIQQAITWIRKHPQIRVIGTNYSVNLVRAQLKGRAVYDMFYPSSQRALSEQAQSDPHSAWRLSGIRLNGHELYAQFPPRFVGERGLYLYQINQ